MEKQCKTTFLSYKILGKIFFETGVFHKLHLTMSPLHLVQSQYKDTMSSLTGFACTRELHCSK